VTVVQRLVFPPDGDYDLLPLYLETLGSGAHPELVLGRHRFTVPAHQRVSFASYFNAFPASYWRRWTVATAVELVVGITGGATVTVFKSNARGNVQRLQTVTTGTFFEECRFTLSLEPFGDGGWYWFEVLGGPNGAVVENATWSVSAERPSTGTATIGITTFNRPDYCSSLLAAIGAEPEVLDRLDRILVVDQGTQRVEDHPLFPPAAQALGAKLTVVHQANLGGSGGFARSMHEAVERGESDYVLLLDDDVLVEPEGILRAITFADLARTPTIVGGHMLNMHVPSMLHTFGEVVNRYRFMWGSAPHVQEAHDFAKSTLRDTEWLHRRIDVDYNGWWMCLIPTDVVRSLGLSLPIFIKWDDADYGLRAKAHGVPTVSLPGAAVWHVPWTDKDDTIDWQAYHHARNRVLMALLHSPYPRGGRVVTESLGVQLRHGLAMQYSAAELRLWALRDILSGPDHLHRDLPTKLGEIRALRADAPDSAVTKDPGALPAVRRAKPPKRGRDPMAPRGLKGRALAAGAGVARQLRPVRETATEHPEAAVAAMDAKWWLLSQFDSALVSTADGTGASWYRRDQQRFRDLMRESVVVHQELARRWDELAATYRAARPALTSPAEWRRTWGLEDDG
jgi:galactofuranosylgalactofuranosylrhamnosyl-N-acetylglucosaminyl-diphospho-decaprenol beta-1,5/1,6-galactofuranosyltransferase